ncbi:hypothetical protein FRC03_007113, partial [Tulasnella sp. 419]
MSMATSTALISADVLLKALKLMQEDLESKNQDSREHERAGESEYTFDQLNKEVQQLESIVSTFRSFVLEKIVGIRRRHNAHSPIHRLPAELLRDIFHFQTSEIYHSIVNPLTIHESYLELNPYRSEWLKPRGLWSRSIYSLTLSVVTTCSYWYRLALSAPRLWAHLDSRHCLDLTNLLLERSKQAPLYISCLANVNKVHEFKFMDLVEDHVHRWMSINIASNDMPRRVFAAMASSSA